MPTKDKTKQAQYNRAHYAKHTAQVKAAVTARKARLQLEIEALKAAPCTDCGRVFPPECMDFDHLDGATKEGNVCQLMNSGCRERVYAEIAKCELVCACCHRIRTRRRARS